MLAPLILEKTDKARLRLPYLANSLLTLSIDEDEAKSLAKNFPAQTESN
jgi:hypothetical protein